MFLRSFSRSAMLAARATAASASLWRGNASLARTFATITASELRKGMIFLENDIYCEVQDYRPVRQGRGAASAAVVYKELPNGKEREVSKPASGKVNHMDDLQRLDFELMYIDGDQICLADADYNEHRVSMDYVPKDLVAALKDNPGIRITALKHKDVFVKLGFPPAILSQKKK